MNFAKGYFNWRHVNGVLFHGDGVESSLLPEDGMLNLKVSIKVFSKMKLIHAVVRVKNFNVKLETFPRYLGTK